MKVLPEFEAKENDLFFLLRDDSMFCTERNVTEFVKELTDLIQSYYDVPVIRFSALEQIEYCKGEVGTNVLSLDKFFLGDFNLDISRIFELGGDQKKPIGYQITNLSELLDWLKTVKFVNIIDDDSATGGTLKEVLKDINCPWEFHSLDILYGLPNKLDICDVRDYIPNSKFGGLLCKKADTSPKRYSYVYPNVNLTSRMSMPQDKCIEFSDKLKKLWEKHNLV